MACTCAHRRVGEVAGLSEVVGVLNVHKAWASDDPRRHFRDQIVHRFELLAVSSIARRFVVPAASLRGVCFVEGYYHCRCWDKSVDFFLNRCIGGYILGQGLQCDGNRCSRKFGFVIIASRPRNLPCSQHGTIRSQERRSRTSRRYTHRAYRYAQKPDGRAVASSIRSHPRKPRSQSHPHTFNASCKRRILARGSGMMLRASFLSRYSSRPDDTTPFAGPNGWPLVDQRGA